MTDQRTPADDLEAIAAALPATPENFSELRDLLHSRLGLTAPELQSARAPLLDPAAGAGGPSGALSLVSNQAVGSESGSIIGVQGQLYYGIANLLLDPTFENTDAAAVAIGTGTTTIGPDWRAEYDLVSGTAPTTLNAFRYYDRTVNPNDNPFNSASLAFDIAFGTAVGTIDLFLHPATGVGGGGAMPELPYLVAGIKFRTEEAPVADVTMTATMQVCTGSGSSASGVVVAESTPLDLESIPTFDEIRALWAPYASPSMANNNFWRLKIRIVKTGALARTCPLIILGEPVLQVTTTAEQPPFQPLLGRWRPFRQGTSFPANPNNSVNNSDRFYRTDLDMEFLWDGTRWMCTCPHQLAFPNEITNLAANDADISRIGPPGLIGGSDIWVTHLDVGYHVTAGTALSASHKWVVDVVRIAPGGAATTVVTKTIDSGASATWRRDAAQAVNALLTSPAFLHLVATKTGTPGNLFFYPTLTYRIVAT